MKFHIEPVQFIVRGYKEGSYDERSPFSFVMNAVKVAKDEVYFFGALGELTDNFRGQIKKLFAPYGITKFSFIHYDHPKVTVE